MSGNNKQLELQALATLGEMFLFNKVKGGPEEAARIPRCTRFLRV